MKDGVRKWVVRDGGSSFDWKLPFHLIENFGERTDLAGLNGPPRVIVVGGERWRHPAARGGQKGSLQRIDQPWPGI